MKQYKYHITTIGCQMNISDSERIAGYLEIHGFKMCVKKEEADLLVFTTCGVRESAESRIYGLIPRMKKKHPHVVTVLTGCLSKRADVNQRIADSVDIWLDIENLPKFSKSLQNFFPIQTVDIAVENYLNLPAKYKSDFSAAVPIGNGCNNFCTYCVVPYARGREVYRPADEIIAEAYKLVGTGYKEINLIAQNVNSYNYNNKYFYDILKAVDDIPGDFWIRFSTSHPKDMSNKLIDVIASGKKICRHVHLPVQAGDDEILSRMNRKYSVAHYFNLVKKIRQHMANKSRAWHPPVAISTDVIIGFPGESEEQFENTANFFREARFDMAYLSQYSPRPGTVAAKYTDDVTVDEKRRREDALNNILSETARQNNQEYLGKTVRILIDEKNKKGEFFGKTEANKTVGVRSSKTELKVGEFVDVKIVKVKDFGMDAEFLETNGNS